MRVGHIIDIQKYLRKCLKSGRSAFKRELRFTRFDRRLDNIVGGRSPAKFSILFVNNLLQFVALISQVSNFQFCSPSQIATFDVFSRSWRMPLQSYVPADKCFLIAVLLVPVVQKLQIVFLPMEIDFPWKSRTEPTSCFNRCHRSFSIDAFSQFERGRGREYVWRAAYSVISKTWISLTWKRYEPVKTMSLFSPVSLV
jgi:hypothetical protein